MNEASRQSTDQIVQLLTNLQQQLTRYVRTLVPNRTDAEEVLQETNLFVWRHADEFQLGRTSRPGRARSPTIRCSRSESGNRAAGSVLAMPWSNSWPNGAAENLARGNDEAEALDLCMAKLSAEDRELMELRYEPGATVEGIARQVGRSTKAVYNALGRIRTWLLECIERTASAARRG